MKAVILAAGCATRLRPYSDDTPKTLLPVAGVPILRRTITSLLRAGFDQFVIGTGYLEHMVRDAVASWFPSLDVTYVSNPDFRTTNNAYSLWLCREACANAFSSSPPPAPRTRTRASSGARSAIASRVMVCMLV